MGQGGIDVATMGWSLSGRSNLQSQEEEVGQEEAEAAE